ncbi:MULTISPECIES: hypothetical protein [unclassified Crossiella]|uniref:hypothetical protein n=1 Tax=unclassified Crossiella TaxID=2620835 RepID=UPI001FFE3C0C|nr:MULTISPECIES: hypothetical protein [unclassified Crossiella]MCK2240076.1 hypothetical protein [Crossiella sp. S99.2]MCK2252785.1 hypothetical protein [Crossiella sp. S99.1]
MSGDFDELPDDTKQMLYIAYGYGMVSLQASPEAQRLAEARHNLIELFVGFEQVAQAEVSALPPQEVVGYWGHCMTGLPQVLNEHGAALVAYREAVVAEAEALNALFPDDLSHSQRRQRDRSNRRKKRAVTSRVRRKR